MKAIAVHFVHEWNAGRRSYPWAVPAEHDSSSGARASAVTVETELQSVDDLLVNYVFLMFHFYF